IGARRATLAPGASTEKAQEMPEHEPEVVAARRRRRKPVNTRLVLSEQFSSESLLCCPRCSYPHVHVGKRYDTSKGDKTALHLLCGCERCGDTAAFELIISDCEQGAAIAWGELP